LPDQSKLLLPAVAHGQERHRPPGTPQPAPHRRWPAVMVC